VTKKRKIFIHPETLHTHFIICCTHYVYS